MDSKYFAMDAKQKRKSSICKKQETVSRYFTSIGRKRSSSSNVINDEDNKFDEKVTDGELVKKKSKMSSDAGRSSVKTGNSSSAPETSELFRRSTALGTLSRFSFDEDNDKRRKQFQSRNAIPVFCDSDAGSSSMALDTDSSEDKDEKEANEANGLSSSNIEQGRGKSSAKGNGKTTDKSSLTPIQQQFLELKTKYPEMLLFIEFGYMYRFFKEDAEIAAKILKIDCSWDHHFKSARVPVDRLFVHVRRLVAAGYKVGIVKQTETPNMKAAGDNKKGPLARELKNVYTKATLCGEDLDPSTPSEDAGTEQDLSPNTYLMCVSEGPITADTKMRQVGIMCVDPCVGGDVIYDSFEDTSTYEQLQTRLAHLQPVEILISTEASKGMEKIIYDVAALSSTEDDRIRIEKRKSEEFAHPHAFRRVSVFFSGNNDAQTILGLDKVVISCLAALISYLTEFSLEKQLAITSNFRQFSPTSRYMRLNKNSIENLEIFANLMDGSERGSLIWLLKHTLTRMGSRLLKKWLAHPLLDEKEIHSRQDAVQDLIDGQLERMKQLTEIMARMPDVEKALCSTYHGKCSPSMFCSLVKSLAIIEKEMKQVPNCTLQSTLLKEIVRQIPDLLSTISNFSSVINETAAREKDTANLFVNTSKFPAIEERKAEIQEVIDELNNHLIYVRAQLGHPGLKYTSVKDEEFLIEVKKNQSSGVPKDWIMKSGTKQVSRYHSPFIVKQYAHLKKLREQLTIDVMAAWSEFLQQFSHEFIRYKKAIENLATLDCLMSLAKTACQDSFCRPTFEKDIRCIEIEEGRHPVLTALQDSQNPYVPNRTSLKADSTRVMVISGPNMGGKSSYIRQVALISIMAQIGSFVPAKSAQLVIIDAVLTRMGAADDLFKGQSTFMHELEEASYIIREATDRSLVILDELGRGTSTHDGVAIAYATLKHFITQSKCFVLFVTHFPSMLEFEKSFPNHVRNYSMTFTTEEPEGSVIFQYELAEGAAGKSYGLNVAKLAGMSTDILTSASAKSAELEAAVDQRISKLMNFVKLWNADGNNVQQLVSSLENS